MTLFSYVLSTDLSLHVTTEWPYYGSLMPRHISKGEQVRDFDTIGIWNLHKINVNQEMYLPCPVFLPLCLYNDVYFICFQSSFCAKPKQLRTSFSHEISRYVNYQSFIKQIANIDLKSARNMKSSETFRGTIREHQSSNDKRHRVLNANYFPVYIVLINAREILPMC
jgi:hypothetical protein